MRALELLIPPPIVALCVAFTMWSISSSTELPSFELTRLPLATLLAVVGITFDLLGLSSFRKANTTINPMKPQKTSSVVSSGIYQVTRNPMYIGLFFILSGWAVFLWSWLALIGPFVFAFYISRFQIKPEEETLKQLFGTEYLNYQQKVRRWL